MGEALVILVYMHKGNHSELMFVHKHKVADKWKAEVKERVELRDKGECRDIGKGEEGEQHIHTLTHTHLPIALWTNAPQQAVSRGFYRPSQDLSTSCVEALYLN